MPEEPVNAGGPNPELIFATLNAFQKSEALHGAIKLGLFTAIGRGNQTVESIAEHCAAQPRAIRILCDFLVVNGFLLKDSKGAYALTSTASVFLNQDSPAYMGSIANFVHSPALKSAFENLDEVVRNGQTSLPGDGSVEPNWAGWVEFARSMAPMMGPAAEEIATLVSVRQTGPIKVLDIAAGHGLFGLAIAQQNPEARIVAQDWAAVLEVARENANRVGVQDRFETLEGDAFDVELGSGYDVILLTNFLHHFDRPRCERILGKVRSALAATGVVVTLEFIPDEGRVSPPVPASFSLTMLGSTGAGDAYTFSELDSMCRAAGLMQSELVELERSPQRVVISRL